MDSPAVADVRRSLVREIEFLTQPQLEVLLEYARFLRVNTRPAAEIEQRFDAALQHARETARREGITEQDIQNEIAAFRAER
jgi:hypothetical protein